MTRPRLGNLFSRLNSLTASRARSRLANGLDLLPGLLSEPVGETKKSPRTQGASANRTIASADFAAGMRQRWYGIAEGIMGRAQPQAYLPTLCSGLKNS